ncbi:MAG: glycosyltransferase family 2 protein [Anaerolineaceae bacterium]|nr:glycosyltransferase family 2 protein [Anaerolineaceae bacterium]
MNDNCSIIIRAYNEEEHIGRLLFGILQQTVQDIQIVLVDSGSTDATVSIASRYPVDIVQIRPQDFTFGRSLNMGISKAEAEFIVIASAHVYPVYPDWLELMLAPFKEPAVALTYGKQRGAEQSHFSEYQYFHNLYPDVSRSNQEHPFCNNANTAIRRSLWEQRPYDEKLPGLEDLDWARWAQQQGHEIVYVPGAEIIHIHQESWKGVYNRYRREAMAFKHIYPQESFGLYDLIRIWSGNSFNDLRIAAQQKKLSANWMDILRFRWMQFWGTYKGYRQSGSLTWELRKVFYYPRMNHIESIEVPERVHEPIRYAGCSEISHLENNSKTNQEAG